MIDTQIEVRNHTDSMVSFADIEVSCGCAQLPFTTLNIPARSKVDIPLIVNMLGKTGSGKVRLTGVNVEHPAALITLAELQYSIDPNSDLKAFVVTSPGRLLPQSKIMATVRLENPLYSEQYYIESVRIQSGRMSELRLLSARTELAKGAGEQVTGACLSIALEIEVVAMLGGLSTTGVVQLPGPRTGIVYQIELPISFAEGVFFRRAVSDFNQSFVQVVDRRRRPAETSNGANKFRVDTFEDTVIASLDSSLVSSASPIPFSVHLDDLDYVWSVPVRLSTSLDRPQSSPIIVSELHRSTE